MDENNTQTTPSNEGTITEATTPVIETIAPVTESTSESVFTPSSAPSAFEMPTLSEPVNTGATLTEQRFPNATKSEPISGATLTEQRFPNSTRTSDEAHSYYTPLDNSNPYTGYVEDVATVPKGMGIASLVLGIIGILATISCCFTYVAPLFSILGIIFGCIQKKDVAGKKPGVAIAGIITSSLGLVIALILIGLSLFGLVAIGQTA